MDQVKKGKCTSSHLMTLIQSRLNFVFMLQWTCLGKVFAGRDSMCEPCDSVHLKPLVLSLDVTSHLVSRAHALVRTKL